MIGLRSILTATDFSTDARQAVARAAMIGTTTGLSKGVVLHVLELSWLESFKHFVTVTGEVEQSMADAASRSLDELVAEIQEDTGFRFDPQVRVGNVVDTIEEVADGFDLLVLGARGKHSFRDFAIGTTAERILRQTRKLVLVVKRRAMAGYRRVMVAVDFSQHSQAALAYSQALAPQGDIYLVHIFKVPFQQEMLHAGVAEEQMHDYRIKVRDQADAGMRRFVENSGADTRHLHRSIEYGSHVPDRLREKAIEMGADLVIVGRHGRSLVERLLLGSVTLHLLAECPCDVLVTQ